MRAAITCLGLLLFLAPSFLHAEPLSQAAQESLSVPATATCPATLSAEVAPVFASDENWCGSPCAPNGTQAECVGYNGCGWLQIDSCSCFNGSWRCLWPC